MAITLGTNTYSGEVLKDLLSHSLQGNDTMDANLLHVKAGIQHKYVFPTIKLGDIIQDNVATPATANSKGTYTLGERYLQPEEFMVYLEFDPRDMEEYWRPFQPTGNLVFRELDPQVQAKMLRLLLERKEEFLGSAIWLSTKGGGTTGITTPSGLDDLGDGNNKYWDGFIKRMLMSAKDDPTGEKVIISGNTAITTGAQVKAALQAMYKKCPKPIRKSKKLKFVMEQDLWDLYNDYLSELTFKGSELKDNNVLKFRGKEIVPIVGISEQTIVLGEFGKDIGSNFWAGVDYANDDQVVKVERLQANSELYFFQMRMKFDVNFLRPGEIVIHTPYVTA